MTETAARITWNDGDEYTGSAGAIGPFSFRIQRLFGQGSWLLTAELPGLGFRDARNEDLDVLKAEAERWLEEFTASIGAVFPEPGQALVAIEEEERPAAFFDEHDMAAIGNWHDDWEPDSRDGDRNLVLRYKPSGGLYRVLPEEDL
jgi:hypothetical protein